uniref:Cytochrome P450 n=1 Tax=Setaria italica TaxID=4555 RepID=K3ZDG7_SETIT
MELSSLLLLPLLIVFFYLSKARAAGRNTQRLPPAPRGLPLIGNLHQVGALPHPALRALAAAHGAPDLLRLRLGQVPALVASSPAAAAALMREHDGAFATRPYFRTAEILTYGFQDLAFAPHGEHWRHVRRLCSAHVLSAARSHRHNGVREREVAALVRTIRERASSSSAGVVDVSKALYGFTNGVICRAVSGTGRLSPEEEGRRSELFRELIEENTALLGGFCVGDYFPSLAWADALSGAGARAWRNFRRWDELLEQVVREHEARAAERQDDGYELTRDAIKSLLADMFAAGTETSFIALEWAMSELVRNPTAMQKLQRELRRSAPADAAGAGTRVFVNAWAAGHDPVSWGAPDEFRPERFLAEDSEVDFRGAFLRPGFATPEELDMSDAPGLTTPRRVPLCIVAKPVAIGPSFFVQ